MRLDTDRTETITNLGGSRKFTMNATAKAFQILSSGIYERKIEAIVRELSCNAYDSHVQAGKSDVPFKVHLPTPLTPVFSVEDFGVGLSEFEVAGGFYNELTGAKVNWSVAQPVIDRWGENVQELIESGVDESEIPEHPYLSNGYKEVGGVYTTYFESTKTDSNEVIGALGLGSKTPFSYTDSFTVTARKGGKEVVFTASIGQSGEPEVVKMFERPWVGDNGVKVEVNVSQKDISEFISCAEKVYSWFAVKPELNKVIFYDIEESVVENIHNYGYHLQPKDGWRSVACKVIMGNVSYDLDLADLQADGRTDVGQFVDQIYQMKADFYFSVDIGDADVAASRETLSLDDRTKENLLDKIEDIRLNFAKNTKDKASKMGSVFELYYNLTPFERKLVQEEVVGGHTLNQLTSTKYLSVNLPDDIDAAFYGDFGATVRSRPRSVRQDSCVFTSCVHKQSDGSYKATVIINDCERKQGLKSAVQENYNLPKNIFVVCDKNSKLTQELKASLDELFFGCYQVIFASSFWDGKLSSVKSSVGGLADKTIKAQRLLKGRSSFSYAKTDFTVEDPSRWAYAEFRGSWFDSVIIFGECVGRGELCRIISELDLDGVIGYNTLNEKKVKRVVTHNLEDLIKDSATKAQCKARICQEVLAEHPEDGPMSVLEGYRKMFESIKSMDAGSNKTLVEIAAKFYLKGDDKKHIRQSITNRVGVHRSALNTLIGRSEILDNLLTRFRLTDNMISEVKDYIEFIRNRSCK